MTKSNLDLRCCRCDNETIVKVFHRTHLKYSHYGNNELGDRFTLVLIDFSLTVRVDADALSRSHCELHLRSKQGTDPEPEDTFWLFLVGMGWGGGL